MLKLLLAFGFTLSFTVPSSASADVYNYPIPKRVTFDLAPAPEKLHTVMTLENAKDDQGLYRVEVCNEGAEKFYYDLAKNREGAEDLAVVDPGMCAQEDMHFDQSVYIKRRGSDAKRRIKGSVRVMYKVQ